jgi:hypothetical protein
MLLAGIQAKPELDPRLKRSGMTPLGLAAFADSATLHLGNICLPFIQI